jgi:hypothetical protein
MFMEILDDGDEKQPGNRRRDGTFAEGNSLGKKWEKGISGNLKGRPKEAILTREIRAQLNDVRADGKTNAQAIVESMIERAVKGDVRAADLIFNRVEGRVLQSVDLSVNTDWMRTVEQFDISEAELMNEVRELLGEFYNGVSDESSE